MMQNGDLPCSSCRGTGRVKMVRIFGINSEPCMGCGETGRRVVQIVRNQARGIPSYRLPPVVATYDVPSRGKVVVGRFDYSEPSPRQRMVAEFASLLPDE